MIPARITRLSRPIRNRKAADTIVPKVPPNASSEDLLCVTAGSTVFSAMMIPTPITTTMVEWPREKK